MRASLLLAALLLAACDLGPKVVGSGTPALEVRGVSGFRRVALHGQGKLLLRAGEARHLVEVRGDDNIVPLLDSTLDGETLRLELAKGRYEPRTPLVITVAAPELVAIEASGATEIAAHALGGSDLELAVSGVASVRAAGKVDRLEAAVSGSGALHLYDLEAGAARVSISGLGSVEVTARDTLDVDVSGSGTVRYRGEPRVRKEISGLGSVVKGP